MFRRYDVLGRAPGDLRIVQKDENTFMPQRYTLFGWKAWRQPRCGGGYCWSEVIEHTTKLQSEGWLRRRLENQSADRERRELLRSQYPKVFPWP